MECSCGFDKQPWAEVELSVPTLESDDGAEELFESLSGLRGVRGVRVNSTERTVLVSYDAAFVGVTRLKEVAEMAGFPVVAA